MMGPGIATVVTFPLRLASRSTIPDDDCRPARPRGIDDGRAAIVRRAAAAVPTRPAGVLARPDGRREPRVRVARLAAGAGEPAGGPRRRPPARLLGAPPARPGAVRRRLDRG